MRSRQSSRKAERPQGRATVILVLLLLLVQPKLARTQENATAQPSMTGSALATCETDLALWLGDQAGVPAPVISRARMRLETVFREIGVRVVWRTDPTDALKPLIVVVVSEARREALHVRDIDALGVTLHAREGRGTAFVFYGRVEQAATNNRVDVAMVLSAALAHEIAHAVLGRGAHAHSGLMLRGWDEQQFRLIRSGLLLFTGLEGHALRKALRSDATAFCRTKP